MSPISFSPSPSPQLVSLICIIAAGVALDKLDLGSVAFDFLDVVPDTKWKSTADLSNAACGFLIFVAIVVIVLEGLIIAQRFLNFGIVDKFTFIFNIVVYASFTFSMCIQHTSLHTSKKGRKAPHTSHEHVCTCTLITKFNKALEDTRMPQP